MSKVAVVYWSSTGNTEAMANAVADGVKGKGGEAVLHTCEDFDGSKVTEYDAIAFGPDKLLFLIVSDCFSEQGFCFRLAFCSHKLFLYFSAAFIFDIEACVPLFTFFSYRTFCHR